MSTSRAAPGHYLIASDFDQTLSFNDSGLVLSELIGAPNFREKVAGLSNIHLVQQGGRAHGRRLPRSRRAGQRATHCR